MRFAWVAMVLAAGASWLAACSSDEPAAVPNVVSARATRDVQDGEAKLSSTVEVRFDRTVVLAPLKVPLSSIFEFEVTGLGGGAARRVLVSRAEVSDSNSRAILLKVDQVVPDGAKLKIAEKAFSAGASGETLVTVEGDLSPALALLATTALSLGRPQLLDSGVAREIKDSDRDPEAMRSALSEMLVKRGADEGTKKAALARYDSISVSTVPAPKLRAALAGLTGTFAEPAIDALLTANNCSGKPVAQVLFQPPPDAPKLIARVTFAKNGQRIISLNLFTEGERIEHLMPILAHEAIHCDNEDSRAEEVAATAFDAFLYLQLAAAIPEIVNAGTPLSRELNIDAIALINSGRRLPESVGILQSPGVARVLPDTSVQYSSFAELVAAAYPGIDQPQSASEPLAELYVGRLSVLSGMQSGQPFNIRYLDELLGRTLNPETLGKAIEAFGLRLR
ncbi:MAG: hypothetical protein ABI782_09050 [Anaerolineaceae bacterium]